MEAPFLILLSVSLLACSSAVQVRAASVPKLLFTLHSTEENPSVCRMLFLVKHQEMISHKTTAYKPCNS